MSKILVTPETLHQAATTFKQGGDESQTQVQKLKATITGLQGQWEGMTQQKFFTDFQQAETIMKNYVELLNNISGQLDTIADRFRQADGQ
jgi:WXG100 family type VII secretion target